MTPKVLRVGLDWLEHSFSGELSDDVVGAIAALKTTAQTSDIPQPYFIGLVELMVLPKAFGFWTYVLKHPEFEIRLSPNAHVGSAVGSIRLSAFGLANSSPATLWKFACKCMESLGNVRPLTLSRVDVAADFQGWEPAASDMAAVVCAASYRGTHGTEKGVQTFQFGKGAIVLRVYNKSEEILHSGKSWTLESWNLTGRYDPQLPVWRVEVQLRRQALAELQMNAERVLKDPGSLLDYGLSWAQLRVPGSDATKTRWAEDSRWTALREGVYGGKPLHRTMRVSELMSLDRAISRYVGAIATAAAYFDTNDFVDANVRLEYAAEAYMMNAGVDFAGLAELKRRRILSEIGPRGQA